MLVSEQADDVSAVPSPDELQTLPRVSDKIPISIFTVAVAEVAERFTFRSIAGPIQNYVQNPPHSASGLPGALGKGQATATAMGFFFQMWCYMMPILGAHIADSWLGRFRTICIGTVIATTGTLLLFISALPVSLEAGAGFPGLIVSLFIIGIGTGGIKSNVGPLIAEQYGSKQPQIGKSAGGQRVILDPDITVQTIFSRYYWITNLGSCAGLVVAWVELRVGFWAVFLMAASTYLFALVMLFIGRNKYVKRPPQGSIVPHAAQALWTGFRNGRKMERAKPSYLAQQQRRGSARQVPWSDHFVDELQVALVACRVLYVIPIFWLCYGTSVGNVISLAGEMNTMGLPNDLLVGSVNPVAITVCLPIFERIIYPSLRRIGIQFRPVSRMACGFIAMSGAIAIAAGIQAGMFLAFSIISFLWLIPIYVLTGISEILALITSMEYAYTKAPRSMKSLVTSLNLVLCAVGAAIGLIISPTSQKPMVLVQYACLSGVMLLLAAGFFVVFSKYNREEEKMNRIEREAE
ncbi:H+/oligopeptide symporter [Microdochium bolleyi]|uniref:H+/oligopeptide symporter n=1 Tax=Microdochium bolleyi TaxID=196109 RepID=A0A136IT96_9PEZI|nr:H+/oligopeptide symporter [Microdochium bolleyi]